MSKEARAGSTAVRSKARAAVSPKARRPTEARPDPGPAASLRVVDGGGAGRSTVLATKVRQLRNKAELTLQELSRRSGVSQSALSKIENGQLSPTYEKIVALARGLGVDVAELFSETKSGSAIGRRTVTRKGEGVLHSSPQYDYEFLCGDLSSKQFMPLLATVKARSAQEFPSMPRHEGEEFVYIVRGEVLLHSEFYEPVRLRTGDSCYFDSSMGHALVSAGSQDAILLWVCSKNLTPKDAGVGP